MLAPLKNRSLIEREPSLSLEERVTQLESANLAARKIVAQDNEISRLDTLHRAARQRVDALESGQAIVELGRRLMALSEANEELADAARRVWVLDKTLCAAHEECARLARERDLAIMHLANDAHDKLKYCN